MASYSYAPPPLQDTFFIPGGNTPGNGVQLFLYVAGSVSTKQTAYKDNAGNASWTNPIVLDSGGNLPNGGVIWFTQGQSYKAVYAPSNDQDPPLSPYRTIDNLSGINDISLSESEWVNGPTPTFVSGTQFTLAGDQTQTFVVARRLKFTVTAGTVYGNITSVSFAANVTTVNVAFDSGQLDSGLASVAYSLITPVNASISDDYGNKQSTTVTSAGNGTTNIWGVSGNTVHVGSTNAIFAFSTAPYVGARRKLIFDAALSLNSSAAITMPGNRNVTTAVNDIVDVYAQTVTSNIIQFSPANGNPFGPQTSGNVFAGPSSGANAIPGFRPLVAADLPASLGGMAFITSAVASQSATIDFTALSTTFPVYVVDIFGAVPATNAAGLTLRMSNDGGATFKAGAGDYVYANNALTEAGAVDSSSSQGNSFILLASASGVTNNPVFGGVNGRVVIYNVNSSSQRKHISFAGTHHNGAPLLVALSGGGAISSTSVLTTSAVNAIRFIEGAGNISTGTFNLYGMNKS